MLSVSEISLERKHISDEPTPNPSEEGNFSSSMSLRALSKLVDPE